ncbi:MAG: chromosome partitioning protein [Candidatus Binatia bacterium]
MPNPIISIANQKGGVGKTTTTISLAACLALQGRRVLIVDIDPQANATSGLGLEKTPGDSVLGPLMGETSVADKIKYTVFENIYVLPSEIDMCGAEIELCGRENPSGQLTRVLEPLRESPDIDLILIDCPPSLGILTLNAFAASDWLIVPLQCEYYALEGISTLIQTMEKLKTNGVTTRLELLGIVMTMYDGRTNLSNMVVDEVQKHFGEKVFETVIPRTTRLAEAPSHGKPITEYDKYNTGAAAYEVLTVEVAKRLGLS